MITTSPDGQWAVIRRGREISLLANALAPATSRMSLETADADLVFVGPPSVLAILTREPAADGEPSANRIALYQPPYLDAVAQLALDGPMRIAAITGPRIVLVGRDGKAVTIVRVVGRGLSAQPMDPGSPVEFAVGLERNQVLFSLLRKLEAWDAIACRPLLRMQLQLPPPPRAVGPALGHLWATRHGSDEIIVCRLSDGRPFRHQIGAPIDDVVHHPASPQLVLVTAHGLVRLHCFAHSLTRIETPWQPGVPLGLLVVGDDISLLGLAGDDEEPWRVPIGGAGAPAFALDGNAAAPPLANATAAAAATNAAGAAAAATASAAAAVATAADKLRAMRERLAGPAEPSPHEPGGEPADAAEPASEPTASYAEAGQADASAAADHASEPPPRMRSVLRPEPNGSRGDQVRREPASPSDAPSAPPGEPGASRIEPVVLRAVEWPPGEPAEPAQRRDPSLAAAKISLVRASHESAPRAASTERPADGRPRPWRDPLVAYAGELARGANVDVPAVAADTELGQLVLRLALSPPARRALIALYSRHLAGEPRVPIARLAQLLGDWTEALGRGELHALAMLRRRDGTLALRSPVADLLDGLPPRAIRLVGSGPATLQRGISRLLRSGRSDSALETWLVAQLGRVALVEGSAGLAALEAQLHGATAVALAPPAAPPTPWPRDAGLIVVTDDAMPAWLAALPGGEPARP